MRKIYFLIFLLCHLNHQMLYCMNKASSPVPRKNGSSSLHKDASINNLLEIPQSQRPEVIQTRQPRNHLQPNRNTYNYCNENINCSNSCTQCAHTCMKTGTKMVRDGCAEIVTENCTPILATAVSLCCTALCAVICYSHS